MTYLSVRLLRERAAFYRHEAEKWRRSGHTQNAARDDASAESIEIVLRMYDAGEL